MNLNSKSYPFSDFYIGDDHCSITFNESINPLTFETLPKGYKTKYENESFILYQDKYNEDTSNIIEWASNLAKAQAIAIVFDEKKHTKRIEEKIRKKLHLTNTVIDPDNAYTMFVDPNNLNKLKKIINQFAKENNISIKIYENADDYFLERDV